MLTEDQRATKKDQLELFEKWLREWNEKPFTFFTKEMLSETIDELRRDLATDYLVAR